MGMSVDSGSGLTNEPNLVPMIDVLLVLLVIFMLMVPMNRRVIKLQLPDPNPSPNAEPDQSVIVLEVVPGEEYRVNSIPVRKDGLADRLREIYDPRPDKIIFVKGDPAVTYQDVMAAMDVARGAGVRIIGIPPKDDKAAGGTGG
jgi:biopolymer transport protein TolR